MKKIKKNQILYPIIAVMIAVVFILIPLPYANLYLRITFDEIAGEYCSLYYTTDASENFSDDKCITSKIDSESNQVSFLLDSSLAGHITGLRLDFPHEEDLIRIKNVTLSSAGVIQKEYNPCHFFADSNIAMAHEAETTLAVAINRVYVSTTDQDPFFIFSDSLVNEVQDCYSQYRLTRLCICLFAAACYLFARKNLFSEKQSPKKQSQK